MNRKNIEDSGDQNVNVKAIGCSFVFMGVIGGIFGMAGLLGIVGNVELEFFSIDLNDQRGRVYWIIGCVAFSMLGVYVMKLNKKL